MLEPLTPENIAQSFVIVEYSVIPEYMRRGLVDYICKGWPPGDFLKAVLQGRLKDSVLRADSTNLPLLPTYVRWLMEFAPMHSWGTDANYAGWLK